jgi:NAD(P)-dependent dehydrogenase (short-subunit alcohol dehydrogenase family)
MPVSRVVAITGASAGIGRATALRLARDGASLVVCARRRDRIEAVASEIVAAGGQALPLVADVTREADMQHLVASAVERFGALDAIVCNAGMGIAGTIEEISAADMQRLMEVNYFGTYHAARAAMPVFRRQGRGHFIIISSIVGKRGVPFMNAYSATKFAQVGLAECMRAELVGTGIHVTLVYPVSTPTEFHDVLERASGARTLARGPKQPVEEVADAIAGAIARPVPELYPFWKARGLVWLNAFAPGLCDRIVRKFGRQRLPG